MKYSCGWPGRNPVSRVGYIDRHMYKLPEDLTLGLSQSLSTRANRREKKNNFISYFHVVYFLFFSGLFYYY